MFEDFGAGFEGVEQACDASLGDLTQERFQLGESFLDGVHIGAVGRLISQRVSRRLYELLDPGCGSTDCPWRWPPSGR